MTEAFPPAPLHLPSSVCCVCRYVLVHRIHHVLTLPGCMGAAVLAFYLLLLATGTSLEQAREVRPPPTQREHLRILSRESSTPS